MNRIGAVSANLASPSAVQAAAANARRPMATTRDSTTDGRPALSPVFGQSIGQQLLEASDLGQLLDRLF